MELIRIPSYFFLYILLGQSTLKGHEKCYKHFFYDINTIYFINDITFEVKNISKMITQYININIEIILFLSKGYTDSLVIKSDLNRWC